MRRTLGTGRMKRRAAPAWMSPRAFTALSGSFLSGV